MCDNSRRGCGQKLNSKKIELQFVVLNKYANWFKYEFRYSRPTLRELTELQVSHYTDSNMTL